MNRTEEINVSILSCTQRISIVGTSGSGKTTLARQVSQCLAIPHIELDALHWEPNWIEVPDDVMRSSVSQALSCRENWVVDGNYSQVRDIVWSQPKTVVWLGLICELKNHVFEIIIPNVIKLLLRYF